MQRLQVTGSLRGVAYDRPLLMKTPKGRLGVLSAGILYSLGRASDVKGDWLLPQYRRLPPGWRTLSCVDEASSESVWRPVRAVIRSMSFTPLVSAASSMGETRGLESTQLVGGEGTIELCKTHHTTMKTLKPPAPEYGEQEAAGGGVDLAGYIEELCKLGPLAMPEIMLRRVGVSGKISLSPITVHSELHGRPGPDDVMDGFFENGTAAFRALLRLASSLTARCSAERCGSAIKVRVHNAGPCAPRSAGVVRDIFEDLRVVRPHVPGQAGTEVLSGSSLVVRSSALQVLVKVLLGWSCCHSAASIPREKASFPFFVFSLQREDRADMFRRFVELGGGIASSRCLLAGLSFHLSESGSPHRFERAHGTAGVSGIASGEPQETPADTPDLVEVVQALQRRRSSIYTLEVADTGVFVDAVGRVPIRGVMAAQLGEQADGRAWRRGGRRGAY